MEKHFGQKIALLFAGLSYLSAAGCVIAAYLYKSNNTNDPVFASLMASVVFCISCGVVLHIIGTARLKGLISGATTDDSRNVA